MTRFRLQFPPRLIPALAERYTAAGSPKAQAAERVLVETVGPAIREAGSIQKGQFLALCRWKSPRVLRRAMENGADLVEEATAVAFAARHEALRIGNLMILRGVSWPVASVLLHFGHPDRYPILDFRAIESLGVKQPSQYTFEFWWAYVQACRQLADKHGVDMRTLDRALWRWSKEQREGTRRRRAPQAG